jgi:hypothetical protein
MSLREFYHLPRPPGGAGGRIRARLLSRFRELAERAATEYDLGRLLADLGPAQAYRMRDVAVAVRRLEWLLEGGCPALPLSAQDEGRTLDRWWLEQSRAGVVGEDAALQARTEACRGEAEQGGRRHDEA